jgi:hypothetical protein
MKKIALALLVLLAVTFAGIVPSSAQNYTCPTPPLGTNDNQCASTAFVQQNALPIGAAPSVPLLYQPPATNCDSGHHFGWLDENWCTGFSQNFNSNADPSVLVVAPVTGTVTPGGTNTLTFTFGAGACVAGCPATYTTQSPFAITASIAPGPGANATMTVTATAGTLYVGQVITGAGVSGGTAIIGANILLAPIGQCNGGPCTGSGGTGTYLVSPSQTIASEAMTSTEALKSIAWGVAIAIKANANLFNAAAVNASQQGQVIWSTANTANPQISLDINGAVATKIVATSGGGSTAVLTPTAGCNVACPLSLDVGTSITYTRGTSFVPVSGSNLFQTFYGGTASGGTGIYGQLTVNVVDPTISLGSIYLAGAWSGVLSGVYVSRGLYSVSNIDNGADTATFTTYFGTTFTGANATMVRPALGTTPLDAFVAANSSLATAGAQQFSPDIRLTGSGWKTNATAGPEQVDWRIVNEPVQGAADPTSNLTFNPQINGTGYTQQFRMGSGGIFNANTGYTINGLAPTGHVPRGNSTAYVDAQLAFADLTDSGAWTAFTPTPTCGTATFTTNSARSKTLGKITFVEFDYTITAIGTCTIVATFTLPNTAQSPGLIPGRELVNLNTFTGCRVSSASATANCVKTGNVVYAVNDQIVGSGVYENQ